MNVVSWNVRGLGSFVKSDAIKASLRSTKGNIILFRETKMETVNKFIIRSLKPYGDVRYAVKDNWGIFLCQFSCQICALVITSVYGPTDSYRRELFWTDLNRVAQKWGKPWVVGGDFSVTYFAVERNSEGPATSSMRDFANWIRFHNLIDLPRSGSSFTWSNNQERHILSRPDKFLISLTWLELFPKLLKGFSQDLFLTMLQFF